MHKLVIAIEPLENEPAFQESWPRFLHLAEKMPGLLKESTSWIHKTLYGAFPYILIHELYFDSLEALKRAMSSPAGREAGVLLQEITAGKVALAIADHNEDQLENIKRFRTGGEND